MYKILVWYNGAYYTLTTANMENCSIQKEIVKDQIFARAKLEGEITFLASDFDYLLEKQNYTNYLLAKIIPDTPVVLESQTYNGYLNLFGEWDLDRKVVKLTFDVFDQYTNFLDEYDKKVDKIGGDKRLWGIEIYCYGVTHEITGFTSPPSAEHNWTYFNTVGGVHYYYKMLSPIKDVNSWDYDKSLITESSTIVEETGDYLFPIYEKMYSRKLLYPYLVKFYRTGYELNSLIEGLLPSSSYSFTQISYLGFGSNYNNIAISNKNQLINLPEQSDINRKEIEDISLKDILTMLRNYFNLSWKIVDWELIILHHDQINPGLPIHPEQYPAHDISGWDNDNNSYEYKKELVSEEKWEIEETDNIDFDGLPIIYTNYKEKTDKEYDCTKFQTNIIDAIIGINEGKDDVEISSKNYVLLALTLGNIVRENTGILSGINLTNGDMAMANLHDKYHKIGNRYDTTGKINGETATFTKTKLNKTYKFKVPFKVYDYDFDKLVKTKYGNMKIVSITEYLSGKLSELKLEY